MLIYTRLNAMIEQLATRLQTILGHKRL